MRVAKRQTTMPAITSGRSVLNYNAAPVQGRAPVAMFLQSISLFRRESIYSDPFSRRHWWPTMEVGDRKLVRQPRDHNNGGGNVAVLFWRRRFVILLRTYVAVTWRNAVVCALHSSFTYFIYFIIQVVLEVQREKTTSISKLQMEKSCNLAKTCIHNEWCHLRHQLELHYHLNIVFFLVSR